MGTRILGYPVLVPFVGESLMVAERSMTGATGNIYCGLHEFEDMAFLLHYLRAEDCFLDVGANIGSYTLLASGVVGCQSVSIEPVPSTFAKLLRNVRINAIEDKVRVLNVVAGTHEGALWFSTDRDTMNRVVGEDYSGSKARIQVQPLDDVLDGQPTVAWKVDVEGFEREVLDGAQHALASDSLRAVLLEGQTPSVSAIMESQGFCPAVYDPFRRSFDFDSKATAASKNNTLWIRDRDFVRERCATAGTYHVLGVAF